MSDVRTMLVETVTKIMKDMCTKEMIKESEKDVWPTALWEAFEDTEMTLVGIPEELGGVGGDVGDALSILKVAGKYSAPIPLAENFLAKWFLSSSGIPVVNKRSTIAPVRKEDSIHFTKVAEGWAVNGRAKYVPWASNSEEVVLYGTTNDAQRVIAYIKTKDATIIPGKNLAEEARDEIVLENLFIPYENASIKLQFSEDYYWNIGTLTRIVLMAGALETVLELTINYSNERSQFGRPIGKFQAIKQQLAVLAGEVVSSNIAADSAVAAIEQGQADYEIAMAKIQVGQATTKTADIAHQVLGAMGFTNEHSLHNSTKRLWSWQDEYGTESELAILLGEQLLSDKLENVWKLITSSSSEKLKV